MNVMARRVCFGALLASIPVVALLPLLTFQLPYNAQIPPWDQPFGLVLVFQMVCAFHEDMLITGLLMFPVWYLVMAVLMFGAVLGHYVHPRWRIPACVLLWVDLLLCLCLGLFVGVLGDIVLLSLFHATRKQLEEEPVFLSKVPSRI